MVEWLCTKERINERRPCILVIWSSAHKKKSINEDPNFWSNGRVQNGRLHPTPITCHKTKCLWFSHEINSLYFCVPQKPKTESKNWVHLKQMFEYIIWRPTGFYFWAYFVSDIYFFLIELWSRFCKSCRALAVSLML